MYHVIRHSIWKISKKTHKKHCNALCMVCNVCLVNALSLAPFFCVVGRSISHNEVKSFLKEHYYFRKFYIIAVWKLNVVASSYFSSFFVLTVCIKSVLRYFEWFEFTIKGSHHILETCQWFTRILILWCLEQVLNWPCVMIMDFVRHGKIQGHEP